MSFGTESPLSRMWQTVCHILAMVEHEVLKEKLKKEFERLGIQDENTINELVFNLNCFAQFVIEVSENTETT